MRMLKNVSKILFIIPLLFLFSSCSYSNYGSQTVIENKDLNAKVNYQSYSYLKKDLKEEAKNKKWSQEKLKDEISYLPEGGYLIFHVYANEIEGANTKNWSCLVENMEGEKIMRHSGKDKVAEETPHESGNYIEKWKNTYIVPIRKDIERPFKVYLFHDYREGRDVYTIKKNRRNRRNRRR